MKKGIKEIKGSASKFIIAPTTQHALKGGSGNGDEAAVEEITFVVEPLVLSL